MVGSRRRFVLVVGDDGALLCEIQNYTLIREAFARSPDQSEEISALLQSRPRQAVSILVDVLDIALRRELVPPAAPWERANVLQRRIARVFPGYRCTGAKRLGREDNGRRDHVYLLAGVPPSTALDSWMSFLEDEANPVRGISLLPVEAVRLITRITKEFAASGENGWRVMITRERTGGFRQVIVNDGVIAFSRLTQSFDLTASATDLAAELETEFGHTVDYLKRLGFSVGDGLELIIVGEERLRKALVGRNFAATQVLMISPEEIVERMGFRGEAALASEFSDALHALAFAGHRKPVMQMQSPGTTSEQSDSRHLAARYAVPAAIVAMAFLYLAGLAVGVYRDREELADLKRVHTGEGETLRALEGEVLALPRPFDQMVAELRNWRALRDETIEPGPVLARLEPLLNENVVLSSFDWQLMPPATDVGRTPQGTEAATFRRLRLRLTFELSGIDGDRVAAVSLGNRLAADLRAIYADFAVSVPRLPVPIRPNETLSVEGGRLTTARLDGPATMEVLVEGLQTEAVQ